MKTLSDSISIYVPEELGNAGEPYSEEPGLYGN